MDAKNLMIGDWVKFTKENYLFKKDEICRIKCPQNLLLAPIVEPIPLAEEILKANGFADNGEFPSKDHIKINRYKDDGWFVTFCECYGYDINYVHELQHALRLCGLTELADNFKLKEE